MICPRCSVAEISPVSSRCELCGYTLLGTQGVSVRTSVADEVHETVQRELSDRFELQVLVRRERASTLYLARDVEDDHLIMLRLIPRQGPVEGPLIHRFAQAATLAAQFRHPHLVPVRRHGVTHSLLWYSMDVVKSRTLGSMLDEADPMPLGRTLELLEQVASSLEYLHRNAVVHAGVNPSTILIDGEGWVRVSDPGTMAAVYRAAGPGLGWEALLDMPYAPPELLERRLMGPAADQYALAVLAYACLAGRPPFAGTTVDDIRRERALSVPPLRDARPDLPAHVETAIMRALRDEPAERFGSVLDLLAVLGGAGVRASGAMLVPTARPTGAPVVVVPPAQRAARRRRLGLAALGLVVAGAAVGAGIHFLGPAANGPWVEGEAPAVQPRTPPPPVPSDVPERTADPVPEAAAAGTPRDAAAPEPAAPAPARAARGVGTLFVNASPWGSLYVDGRLVGNTPQPGLRLAAGVHRLRIVRDGFVPWEQEVRLRAGETVRLTDIVLQPIAP